MKDRYRQLSDQTRWVLVVTNPSAGQRSRHNLVQEFVAALEERGLSVQLVTDLGTLAELAERHKSAGNLRAVVAAGGDGTVAEVVNRTQAGVPITVFPLGTANLLARYFAIDRSPATVAQMIAAGDTLQLDAASGNGRIFLLMAGCGFDAEVVQRLHDSRHGSSVSYWSYRLPIWQAIRSYRYPLLRVYCDRPPGDNRQPADLQACWAFAVNLPAYAGGLPLVRSAVGTDGRLDVCIFTGRGLLRGLRYLAHVKLGIAPWLRDYRTKSATRVRIEADEPVRYQLDGDPGGVLPLEIELLPRRVTLLAPLASIRQRLHEAQLAAQPTTATNDGAKLSDEQ